MNCKDIYTHPIETLLRTNLFKYKWTGEYGAPQDACVFPQTSDAHDCYPTCELQLRT